jgi:hypothetical protein
LAQPPSPHRSRRSRAGGRLAGWLHQTAPTSSARPRRLGRIHRSPVLLRSEATHLLPTPRRSAHRHSAGSRMHRRESTLRLERPRGPNVEVDKNQYQGENVVPSTQLSSHVLPTLPNGTSLRHAAISWLAAVACCVRAASCCYRLAGCVHGLDDRGGRHGDRVRKGSVRIRIGNHQAVVAGALMCMESRGWGVLLWLLPAWPITRSLALF